jgi:hypothetical protein
LDDAAVTPDVDAVDIDAGTDVGTVCTGEITGDVTDITGGTVTCVAVRGKMSTGSAAVVVTIIG